MHRGGLAKQAFGIFRTMSQSDWWQMPRPVIWPCPLLYTPLIYIYIDSPSVAPGLRHFSTQESQIKNPNHKLLGEWLKFLIQLSRAEKYRNPHGKPKENLFLPLFDTNFISKSFGGPLQLSIWQHAGKGTRYFNPLEDYRLFHHWFSGVKTP